MAWVRLEDGFMEHPKVIKAGPAAAWLFICGLGYANRNLTDGFIPSAVVPRLADLKGCATLARRLVDVRLWERADGGYQVHDYLAYQPSAARLKEERERSAARVEAWRKRRSNAVTTPPINEGGNAPSNGVTSALVTPLVTPPPAQTQPGPELPQPQPGPEGATGGAGGDHAAVAAAAPSAPPPQSGQQRRVRPAPKPEPRRDRFAETLDAIKARDAGLVVGGNRDRNAKAVNEAMAEPALIAEAYVALMHGDWQDQHVVKQGSLHAVVDNLGGYVNSKRAPPPGRRNGSARASPPLSALQTLGADAGYLERDWDAELGGKT